jgi:hypothetical protein
MRSRTFIPLLLCTCTLFRCASVAEPVPGNALPPPGLHEQFPISRKMYSASSGYFQTPLQRKAGDYFERFHAQLTKAQPQIQRDRPRDAVAFAPGSKSCLLFVPPDDGQPQPWGIYLHLSPSDKAVLPEGYDAVCQQHRLLFVSPHQGGNERGEWLRTAQALDALATLQATGRIDPKRVFIGGFSGGGYMCFWIQALYPQFFAAALNHGRDFPLQPRKVAGGTYAAAMPYLTMSDWRSLAARPNRWAFLMGTADPNWPLLQEGQKEWASAGLPHRVFSLNGYKHSPLPPATLSEALIWAEAANRPRR